MNLNTLSIEKVSHKSGSLPVALYPNMMIQDKGGKASYYAMTIIRDTCYDEDIANDIIVSGLNEGLSKFQLLRVMELARNAKLARLADAYAVDDGISRMQLKVKGSFDSEQESFSSEKHSVEIALHPTSEAKKYFENLRPVIRQGNSKKPVITSVYDVKSKSSDTLTKGGYLEIKGAVLKISGDNEDVGLYFENTEDSSDFVKVSAEELGQNMSSTLACVVPAELKSGTYRIKVVTQFMNGKTFRKTPLEAVFGSFTVA